MNLPNAIKLYGANAIDENSLISVSSGNDTKEYLRDGNRATKWVSVGENSDLTVSNITINFKNDVGGETTKDFDALAFLNTNWGGGVVQYINSLNEYRTISAVVNPYPQDPTSKDFIFELSSATSRLSKTVILLPQYTTTANQEKEIGEVLILKSIMTFDALTEWSRKDESKEGGFYTRGGYYVKWKEFSKVAGDLTIANLTQTQRDLLMAQIASYNFFTIAFFDEYDAKEIYTFALAERPSETFDRKTQLYRVTLSLRQK